MRAERRGQGTVEVALVLPLIVFTIAAMVDFARYYNVQQTMHRISNVGLNYATQRRDSQDYPSPEQIEAKLRSSVLPPLNQGFLRVDKLDTAVTDGAGKKSVELEMSYLVPFITPIVGAFFHEGGIQVKTRARLPYPEHGTRSEPVAEPTPVPPPAFTVVDGSGIKVGRSNIAARIKVIGKRLTWSGNEVPITLKYSFRGDSFMDAFGGEPVTGGSEFTLLNLADGDWLSFKARGYVAGGRRTTYDITLNSSDPDNFSGRWHDYSRAYTLRAGDEPIFYQKPEIDGYLAQSTFMQPYLDTEEMSVRLGNSELMVVFEFHPDYDQAQADFQDLVLLLQFYDPLAGPAPTVP